MNYKTVKKVSEFLALIIARTGAFAVAYIAGDKYLDHPWSLLPLLFTIAFFQAVNETLINAIYHLKTDILSMVDELADWRDEFMEKYNKTHAGMGFIGGIFTKIKEDFDAIEKERAENPELDDLYSQLRSAEENEDYIMAKAIQEQINWLKKKKGGG